MEANPSLDALEEAIHALESLTSDPEMQGCGARHFSREDLVRAVARVEHAGRLVDALRVEVAHEVDARTLKKAPENPADSFAHFYGFSSTHDVLRQLTLVSGTTISRRLRVAKHCRTEVSLLGDELPSKFAHLGKAFFSGDISIDAAEHVTRELGRLPSHVATDHIDLAERVLVSHATGRELAPGVWDDADAHGVGGAEGLPVHTDDLKTLTAGWVAALDQDGSMPREEQVGRRYFKIGAERHGLVPVVGALLPEVAAGLGRMFDAITNPRTSLDTHEVAGSSMTDAEHSNTHVATTATGVSGSRVRFVPSTSENGASGESEIHDSRTPAQQRHDALATIFMTAMKHAEMPKLNGEALSLTIQVTEENLMKRGGTAWLTDAHGQLTLLDSAAARHAGCAGGVLRVTQDQAGRIIELETLDRVFNRKQRKAIMLRDGGCVIPGCTVSAIWCEVHHVEEWADGGKTHTDNGVLVCWFHHRYLETHGWQITMHDGVPQVKAPAWLDPEQHWRRARSIHRPPRLSKRQKSPSAKRSTSVRESTGSSTRIVPESSRRAMHECSVSSASGWANEPASARPPNVIPDAPEHTALRREESAQRETAVPPTQRSEWMQRADVSWSTGTTVVMLRY